jgi:GT2 family glycosyltransferase
MKCTIVIPVYGRSALTAQCLDTLLLDPPSTPHEILVVNDASTDDTADVLARYGDRVRVLTHEVNRGFATACNSGAAAAGGEFLVFLNNDVVPTTGWLEALMACAEAPEYADVAAFGSRLLFPDDTIQHAGVVIRQDGYPWHIYNGFPADHSAVSKTRRFTAVTAACMLIRRSTFESLSGFDATFHNGFEDVDLCLRLAEAGYGSLLCHQSVLYHLESATRAGRQQEIDDNTRIFRDRWLGRLRPNDFQYYLDDGLIRVEYESVYPLKFSFSPALGVDPSDDLGALLNTRSRQMFRLMQENVRLTLKCGDRHREAPRPRDPVSVSSQPVAFVSPGRIHTLPGADPEAPIVSVILPVKNGGAALTELMARIKTQSCSARVQIVAIDSGSTDGSVELLIAEGARLLTIPPQAFDHGETRNAAVRYADGEMVVFLTQRAIPANDSWLSSLLSPLAEQKTIAGVCSRVVPRPDADLITRFDVLRDPSGSRQRQVRKIDDWLHYRNLTPHELRLLINFHTVSAAIRKSVLQRIPFRSVDTLGEDILWAREVLEAGYEILHEPASEVEHSHDYTVAELFQRSFDDGYANARIVGRTLTEVELRPLIEHLIELDRQFLREQDLTAQETDRWLQEAVARRTAQILGQWCGVNWTAEPMAPLSLAARIRRSPSMAASRDMQREEEMPLTGNDISV